MVLWYVLTCFLIQENQFSMFSGQIYVFYVQYFTENDWNIDIKNIKIRRDILLKFINLL